MKSFITSGASCYVKLYIALVAILFCRARTGLTILVAGLMRNICVKLFEFSGPAVHFGTILLEVLI